MILKEGLKMSPKVHFMQGMFLYGEMEDILNEVAPPGFGHTKSGKGDKKGGTAAAFDRARKEGRFKGSKSDMFAIMWSQKNKGDKPHYKPGTNKKYKKYQDEDWKPEIEVIDTKKRKKEAEKKRKAAADSLPPHLRLDVMKKAFSSTNEETTFKQRDKELKKTSVARNQRYKDLHKKTGSGNTDVNERISYQDFITRLKS